MSNSTSNGHHFSLDKVSWAGLVVTLGIIFGDIGTSPLYVMKAIINEGGGIIHGDLILGGISCVFWTLTLQTTIKYVMLTLRADNKGEGGIFSLYNLVRHEAKWLTTVAIIGGAALLADGIITPPISVASAVEGLRIIKPDIPTVPIVIFIISCIFMFQRFGTAVVGRFFGPVMFVWFMMLALLGFFQIIEFPAVLQAFNPMHGYNMLAHTPHGFWLLGAVFLCTTGAEALYSDLGHCGRPNIRFSWVFVKICLLLNYLGQGAWLLKHEGELLGTNNPFYTIMPSWFLYIGIGIATLAAIIASQALITGSFTLVAEAIRLHLLPKMKVNYPSNMKGQIYIPSVNNMLWAGCIGVVLYFRESSNMEAAYGLAITATMLMTTILLLFYLKTKNTPVFAIAFIGVLYFAIEIAFLLANLVKFPHGGYVSVLIAGLLAFAMFASLRAYFIKKRYQRSKKIDFYKQQLIELSNDQTLPKYATNLVYLSSSDKADEIEERVLYSILQKQPKRADIYWFVHVETTEEPDTQAYYVKAIAPNDVYFISFRLGFRVAQRMNIFIRQVIEDLVNNNEVNIESRYHSLRQRNVAGDFRFVIIEEYLSADNQLPIFDQFVMNFYAALKGVTGDPAKWFGLETSLVDIEKVPLVIRRASGMKLERLLEDPTK
jgi:KUP system potassium uptake protein